MRAGLLDKLITIQQNTVGKSAMGSPVDNWSDFAIGVWANINDASGREFLTLHQLNAQLFTTVLIRYLPGLNDKMRVVEQEFGTVYEIKAILVRGRKHSLELKCEVFNGSR